jgi:hypothetical protein
MHGSPNSWNALEPSVPSAAKPAALPHKILHTVPTGPQPSFAGHGLARHVDQIPPHQDLHKVARHLWDYTGAAGYRQVNKQIDIHTGGPRRVPPSPSDIPREGNHL